MAFQARRLTGYLLAGMILLAELAVQKVEQPQLQAAEQTIRIARADWDTSWFEAEVFRQLLQKAGYPVAEAKTLNDTQFFDAVSRNEVDFWASGWFPNSEKSLAKVSDRVQVLGYMVKAGALQGYLIDKKTSEQYGITNLRSLQRPEIAKLFDIDNDGKADLVGCNPDWTCGDIVEHHLSVYGLRNTVVQVRGNYSSLIGGALARYKAGKPVLFYTWTPNWTVGKLLPGKDVIWLEVPFSSLPKEQKEKEGLTNVPNVIGCNSNPCNMGWPPNDIRVVANRKFLERNPAAGRLLEKIEIPLGDISKQNARMFDGENTPDDIRDQASQWIKANHARVDRWLSEAIQAKR